MKRPWRAEVGRNYFYLLPAEIRYQIYGLLHKPLQLKSSSLFLWVDFINYFTVATPEEQKTLVHLFKESTCEYLAGKGAREAIEILRRNGCPWSETTFTNAAVFGHLTLLQWLYRRDCPKNGLVAAYETIHKMVLDDSGAPETMGVLQWMRQEGIASWHIWLCGIAAMRGHLEVLKWGLMHRCLWDKEDLISTATHFQHEHIMEWVSCQ